MSAPKPKLFMAILGCKPEGRRTEQHDIFFGIAASLKELVPQMKTFWPEAKGRLHIDAWREVTAVGRYQIEVVPKTEIQASDLKLFFLNLGGYKPGEFEEYHYKVLTVSTKLPEAIKNAKATSFYKHFWFSGAVSHIDDKYGLDVDDSYNVEDLLPESTKSAFALTFSESVQDLPEDVLHIGYLKIDAIK